MDAQSQINKIIDAITIHLKDFNDKVPAAEKRAYEKALELVKNLKTENGKVVNSVENLRLIAKMGPELEKAILDGGYQKGVVDFTKAFDLVAQLNNAYFSSIATQFKPTKLLTEIRNQAVTWTVKSLTESGVNAQFAPAVTNILQKALISGGSYAQLTEEVREYMLSNKTGDGALAKYARQVTTDALNQYAANYNSTITADLGLKWRIYSGSNLETTRDWCLYMTRKKYVHEAEFDDILTSNIDGVEICSDEIKCSKKTGLARGLKAGTNKFNILANRGGWECGHQWISVTESMVPLTIRISTYNKYGIKHVNGVAAPGAVATKKPDNKPAPTPVKKQAKKPEAKVPTVQIDKSLNNDPAIRKKMGDRVFSSSGNEKHAQDVTTIAMQADSVYELMSGPTENLFILSKDKSTTNKKLVEWATQKGLSPLQERLLKRELRSKQWRGYASRFGDVMIRPESEKVEYNFVKVPDFSPEGISKMSTEQKEAFSVRLSKKFNNAEKPWTITHPKTGDVQNAATTVTHELAHVVQYKKDFVGYNLGKEFKQIVLRSGGGLSDAPSRYGETSYIEMWAECFSAYTYNRDAFKRGYPKAYQSFEKTLDLYGIDKNTIKEAIKK